MIRIVCWKWYDPNYRWNNRFIYGPEHVNVFANMINRNLTIEHEVVCVTDDPMGIDKSVRCVPIWNDLAHMGGCYRRLYSFSEDARKYFGDRFVSMDLDCVVIKNIDKLLTRTEDFIALRDVSPNTYYCGSMFMMDTGSRQRVWDEFDPEESPKVSEYQIGTDQAWISHCLGPHEAVWAPEDGVLNFRKHFIRPGMLEGRAIRMKKYLTPPEGARIIFFTGPYDPSMNSVQTLHPWIKEHYR